jgi:hypothetical protein
MAHHYVFGTGNIYILPSGATPIQVAAIQNASVDFDGDAKQLYGQNQFPLDTARGKIKITGKFEIGQVNLNLWNSVFFGMSSAGLTTGQTVPVYNEADSVPGSIAYTITVSNAATFSADLGVYYAAGATTGVPGTPLTLVASGPAVGQYSVSGSGVYTFALADASAPVLISYEYTVANTVTGYKQSQQLAVTNQLMGSVPVFGLHLNNTNKTKSSVLQLYACTCSKLQFPLKQDDYGLQSVDVMAQDDGTGRILNWSATQG